MGFAMPKRTIITGITGRDRSCLADVLVETAYQVVGVVRRSSAPNLRRIEHPLDRVELRPADLITESSTTWRSLGMPSLSWTLGTH